MTIRFVDMEATYCISKPPSTIQHKLVHSNGSVHPKFPYGWKYNPALFLPYVSVSFLHKPMLSQILVSLLSNLFCFVTFTFCHCVLGSGKQLPSFYLLLDHIGIILHKWGTPVSVWSE